MNIHVIYIQVNTVCESLTEEVINAICFFFLLNPYTAAEKIAACVVSH